MESLSLRFLYNTIPGRALLKLLTRPGLSRLAGRFLDSRTSRLLIPLAARAWRVDFAEFEAADCASFNAFFTRRRQGEFIHVDSDRKRLVSPCDGRLSVHEIAADSRFSIKNSSYSVAELLNDSILAERFRGGLCLIFRLAPRDYHRYCYIDDGELVASVAIPGVLHCVRPIACARYPVYVQNSREYAVMQTERLGMVVQMEIGALLVGRIANEPLSPGARVRRYAEKGRFEFGGSTVVLLFERGRIALDARIREAALRGEEVPVCMGEGIGAAVRGEG